VWIVCGWDPDSERWPSSGAHVVTNASARTESVEATEKSKRNVAGIKGSYIRWVGLLLDVQLCYGERALSS
jgi:hypothetical protein